MKKAILAIAAAVTIAGGNYERPQPRRALIAMAAGSARASPAGLSQVPSSAAPSPTANRVTTRRRRAMWCTGVTANPIRWLAQAAIGRVGRSPSTPMATRSAGAALASSAHRLR